MKYYDNKESHGIIIEWKEVFKKYKKLHCPKEIYDPTTAPVESAKYFQLLSERTSGKTTAWILIGMILNQMYGTIIQYIRQSEDMIKPSIAGEIFKVILTYDNGRYIREITGNKYDGIYIHWKKAYFCNHGDDGKMKNIAPQPFLQYLSIDQNFDYKSGYNSPTGDLILFDEFVSPYYRLNECLDFMDLTNTIIRKRKTPIIVMLGNTIDSNNTYFREFEISKQVKKLKKGQHDIFVTEKGTRIYVELIELGQSAIKQEVNKLFYGFSNPKLASITGGEIAWSFDSVPHIFHEEGEKSLSKLIKLDCEDEILTMEIMQSPNREIFVNIYPCTKVYGDSLILTTKDITEKNQIFGYGEGTIFKLIWALYKSNKFYYSDNETGAEVKNYIRRVKQLQLERL